MKKTENVKKLTVTVMGMMIVSVMLTGCGKDSKPMLDKMVNETEEIERKMIPESEESMIETEGTETTEKTMTADSGTDHGQKEKTLYNKFLGIDGEHEISAFVENGVSIGYYDFACDYVGQQLTLDELYNILCSNSMCDIHPDIMYQILEIVAVLGKMKL